MGPLHLWVPTPKLCSQLRAPGQEGKLSVAPTGPWTPREDSPVTLMALFKLLPPQLTGKHILKEEKMLGLSPMAPAPVRRHSQWTCQSQDCRETSRSQEELSPVCPCWAGESGAPVQVRGRAACSSYTQP